MVTQVAYSRTALRRIRLFKQQEGCCCWCSERMQCQDESAPDFASFEHLLPRRFGGKNNRDNIVLAHKDCNVRRGHSFPSIVGRVLTKRQRQWYSKCQEQAKRW